MMPGKTISPTKISPKTMSSELHSWRVIPRQNSQVEHRERLVHAHQGLTVRARLSVRERKMQRARRQIAVGDHAEASPGGLDLALAGLLHQRLGAAAVFDQAGDRADL